MATSPEPPIDVAAIADAIRPMAKRMGDTLVVRIMDAVGEQLATKTGSALAARIQDADDETKRFSVAYADQARKAENALSNGTILAAAQVLNRSAKAWEDLDDNEKGEYLVDATAALNPVADALGLPRPKVPTLAEVTFDEPVA